MIPETKNPNNKNSNMFLQLLENGRYHQGGTSSSSSSSSSNAKVDDESSSNTRQQFLKNLVVSSSTIFGAVILSFSLLTSSPLPVNAVSGGGLDYANLDITGKDFSNSNYKGKDFTQVIAKGTNFAKSNLQGCRFYKAYLVRTCSSSLLWKRVCLFFLERIVDLI